MRRRMRRTRRPREPDLAAQDCSRIYSPIRLNASQSGTRTSASAETEIFPSAKRKATLDELHSPLDGHTAVDREQQMKVIRHHDKLMQAISSLRAIVVQNAKKSTCGSVRLKQIPFLSNGGCHEERACSRDNLWRVGVANGDGHTQRLKPFPFVRLSSAPQKACPDTSLRRTGPRWM
jgi:hypothetical protein